MKKVFKFIAMAIVLMAGRFYDVYTTWLYTPQLDRELNPLVKFLGAGWSMVITVQVLLSFAICGCLYFYMFSYMPVLPLQSRLSRRQDISYLLYKNVHSYRKFLYKLPRNKGILIALTGYIGTRVLICISFIVGTSTTLLLYSPVYRNFYKMGIPYLFYVLILLMAAYFYYHFFDKYYHQYLTQAEGRIEKILDIAL